MSYDIDLRMDTGAGNHAKVWEWDGLTYNLHDMIVEGLGASLRTLSGKRAADVKDHLRRMVSLMEDEPARFRKHNPENGWGTYEGLLEFFREFSRKCAEHPACTIHVS